MLRLLTLVSSSLRIVGVLMLVDCVVAYGTLSLDFSFTGVLGDLVLVEGAILFLAAGLIDLSSSITAAEFRKTIFHTEEGYSSRAHKEAEKRALSFFLAGVIMFAILVGIRLVIGT